MDTIDYRNHYEGKKHKAHIKRDENSKVVENNCPYKKKLAKLGFVD